MHSLTNSISESQGLLVHLLREGGTKKRRSISCLAGPRQVASGELIDTDRPYTEFKYLWPAEWLKAAKTNHVSSIPRLEEFAGHFCRRATRTPRLRSVYPCGPQFRGHLAFEVGRQFQMRGGKVDAIVIIDKQARMEGIYRCALTNLRQCWSGTPADRGRLTPEALADRVNRFALTARWLLGKAKARIKPALSPEGRGIDHHVRRRRRSAPLAHARALLYTDKSTLSGHAARLPRNCTSSGGERPL